MTDAIMIFAIVGASFVIGGIAGGIAAIISIRREARRRELMLNKIFGEEQPR